MFYTIYKITNRVNNKIYVGKHQTETLDDCYMGSGTLLLRAIEKYGIDKFDKEILYVFDNEEQMNNMEKEIVNEEFLLREDVYNLKVGGDGGFGYINSKDTTETTKKGRIECDKIMLSKYGDDWRQILGKKAGNASWDKRKKTGNILIGNPYSFLGKRHTDGAKKIIGQKNSIHQSGNKNSMYGMMWIYNLETLESKRIGNREEIPIGWVKGRKIKK